MEKDKMNKGSDSRSPNESKTFGSKKPGARPEKRMNRKFFTKSGVVAGFVSSAKNLEMVVIDVAAKVNSLVNLNEFTERPKLGERYTFEVVRKNEDGGYILSKSAFDKNSKKNFSDYLDVLSRRLTPVKAEVLGKDVNGYEVKLLGEKLNESKAFLVTAMDLNISDQINVVITNFVGDRIRCVLKVDEKLPVQSGDIIKGRVVSGNDFFAIMACDSIPEGYEINVYKADYGSMLDYDSRVENSQEYILQVMWIIGRNIFCRLMEDELKTGEVYSGVIESIKHNGIFVAVKNNSVFVSLSEFAWGGYSDDARRKMKIGDEVRVYVLHPRPDDTRLHGSLKMSNPKPFEEFIAHHKIGESFEVEVITVCKEDPKRKSKMVLVKPKDKKFDIIMTLYLSSATVIEAGQTVKVAIKAITTDNKVVIYLVNTRYNPTRYASNRFFASPNVKYDCIVTKVLQDGIAVALEENPSVSGNMYISGSDQYSDGSGGKAQSKIKCFIEWKNGAYVFTSTSSGGTAFGDLLGNIEY